MKDRDLPTVEGNYGVIAAGRYSDLNKTHRPCRADRFGHGLSYTRFTVTAVIATPSEAGLL
jgi:hypothetical protein